MNIAVVDIGTNSTRLLVAEVTGATIRELDRRSEVTRLGEGVEASGSLSEQAIERVTDVLEAYRAAIDARACERTVAVLTSAVRDAANGAQFSDLVRDRFGFDARVIAGEEEAQLTFAGAMAGRTSDPAHEPVLVIDIGGGSTEFIIGRQSAVSFHVSTQVGVVRQGERHIHHDPPEPAELQALAADVHSVIAESVAPSERAQVASAIAVAGTATALAAIDQELEPYSHERVHGYRLSLASCELMLARLAAMSNDQRREIPGLHPDRAPTIVAGAVTLIEALRLFELDSVEVGEHDILWGVALRAARDG